MELHSQQKTLDMQRGLFLIKYEASEDSQNPPTVQVTPDQGSEGSVELLLPPDAERAVLWSPGATLVARAINNGRLRLTVAAVKPGGSTSARIQVLALTNDPNFVAGRRSSAPIDLSSFRLLGHVAGRGDVVVDADSWVAGPLAPSRIEGLAVQWPDKARGLTFRYSVVVGGPRPVRGAFVEAGTFAGTRGRALPLTGATLEISGPTANGQQLVVDSVFLGSPQMRTVGQRVVLSGPTGGEPLVGLRVRIDPVDQPISVGGAPAVRARERDAYLDLEPEPVQMQEPQIAAAERKQEGKLKDAGGVAPPAAKRSSRVRVFRSQGRKPLATSPAAS
jgi:hypothetical protein